MGVQITELLVKKEVEIAQLKNKTIAVDAPNHLYQFLSTIRQRDGSLFTDSDGNITSHLIGLLSRTTTLLKNKLKLFYVFDGKVPELKRAETRKRHEQKERAAKKYEEAEEKGDLDEMKKYAARTSKLTPEMIEEAKKLLEALGVPHVQAPSEGEAQAAYMAKKGDCYAVASQDADCLLFQAPLLLRNLSISGRKKVANKISFQQVNPEIISLKENLKHLGINQEQLISLAMLVGTDYNNGGIRGIGPKNGLKIVKEHKKPEKIFKEVKWDDYFDVSWEEVYELISKMPTTDSYKIKFEKVDREKAMKLLVDKHNFSEGRVEKAIADLIEAEEGRKQKGLMDFG
ncbi:flap endonuclease-1 [Candidatus Woesearchaeota archaeon]|nr:flap endonuclease-1 [Candidatus Woesearchaeota archaeon]|tara:strand:+ start:3849 stop:4880 length:1032 start_codon:yes stop_codon:yes gene_type:complete